MGGKEAVESSVKSGRWPWGRGWPNQLCGRWPSLSQCVKLERQGKSTLGFDRGGALQRSVTGELGGGKQRALNTWGNPVGGDPGDPPRGSCQTGHVRDPVNGQRITSWQLLYDGRRSWSSPGDS